MKKLIWILLSAIVADTHAAIIPTNESVFGFVDLLQWQVREGGAENWAQTITPAGEHRSATIIDAPFDWNTGVRLGIGRTFNQKSFDLSLIYTHYQTTANSEASGVVYSSYVGNYFVNNIEGGSFGPNYHSANIRWQFFYNTADLNLGKDFTLDSLLSLHPFLGLKTASIRQRIYSNWMNPTTPTNFTAATEDLVNDFWGVGPTIGINSTWSIYDSAHQSFNLIGNLATGILWGHWDINEIYANNTPITVETFVSSINGASPMVDGLLGLEWTNRLGTSDMSIRLGYEAQIWYNQVQFYSLSMGRVNRPATLQGGDLEFRFNI